MARSLVLAAFLLVALAGPAAAVVVDDFTTNQATVSDPPGGATTVAAPGALGGRRGLAADLLAGAGPVSTAVSGGALSLAVTATTPDSRGEAVVTWDGDSNPNALSFFTPQDLEAGGHRSFRLRVTSAGAGTELELEVYSDAANSSVAALRLPAVAAATDFYLSWAGGADFVPRLGAGADFSSVGAIVLTVRGTETSATVDLLETVGAAVTASKRDLALDDTPIAAPQPTGTTFKYRMTITNTGGEAARVAFSDVNVDANLTLDAATADATVVAVDDAYRTWGNVPLTVSAVDDATLYDCDPSNSVGLLSNDCDPDNNPDGSDLTVTTVGAVATALGGSATVAADGSFTYTPPVGVGRAVDSFAYSVADDDGNSAAATVTVAVGQLVWFVDDAHPGSNLGTRDDPFVGITAANVGGAGGVGDQDGPGDIIFLYEGSLAGSLALEAGQTLWGQGDALVLDGTNIVAAGGAPTIISPAGNGITLATGNALRGLAVGNTAGVDVVGSNFGTLTVSNVALTGTGGALDLSNGALAATFTSIASTNATGRGVNLDTVTGALTVSGGTTVTDSALAAMRVTNSGSTFSFGATTLTSVAAGLDLSNNATSTFTFSSLAVTTDAGAGLLANNSGTLSIGGSGNTVVAAGGAGVDITGTSLGSGATFATVSSSGSPGKGVNLDTVTGSFVATGGSIATAAGVAFDVNAGSSTITYAGSIVNTANRAVEITGRTGGTVTLSGSISDTGTGINVANNNLSGAPIVTFSGSSKVVNTGTNPAVTLDNNDVATINFTGGGLDVDTTSGLGFNAVNGALGITVQGSGNTITSTTGTALNVVSSTIGASGLSFERISKNGGANGIVLNGTGPLGGLTVTGSGAVDSGGTILNTTGDAISLTSTRSISLTRMRLEDNLGNGIYGSSVSGLDLSNVRVIDNADNDATDEAGIHLVNLLGTSTWSAIEVADSFEDNVRVLNNGSNTLTQLTISNSTIRDTSVASPGNNGLLIQADGSANMTVDVAGTDFLRNRANGVQVVNNGGGTVDVEIGGSGSDFTDNNIGVNIAHNSGGTLRFDVTQGTFNSTLASAVNLNLGGASTVGGLMEGNVIGNVIDNNDSLTGPGIRVTTNGAGTMTVLLQNNTITEVANRGVEMIARDGSSTLNATLFGNNVNLASPLAADAVHIAAGAISTDTVTVCADLNGDNVVANRNSVVSAGINGIRVRQRFTGTTFTLEDYAGAASDMTAVRNFIAARNDGGDTYVADFQGSGFGTTAACPMPSP